MKPENTYRMLRQLAQFIRQRRGEILEKRLSNTGGVTEVNGSKVSLQNITSSSQKNTGNIIAITSALVASPSVKTIVNKHSSERIVVVPAAEFVEVFRDLEQVRKDAFEVWWASRNEHTETTVAA